MSNSIGVNKLVNLKEFELRVKKSFSRRRLFSKYFAQFDIYHFKARKDEAIKNRCNDEDFSRKDFTKTVRYLNLDLHQF